MVAMKNGEQTLPVQCGNSMACVADGQSFNGLSVSGR
jgi:hypothetical protein